MERRVYKGTQKLAASCSMCYISNFHTFPSSGRALGTQLPSVLTGVKKANSASFWLKCYTLTLLKLAWWLAKDRETAGSCEVVAIIPLPCFELLSKKILCQGTLAPPAISTLKGLAADRFFNVHNHTLHSKGLKERKSPKTIQEAHIFILHLDFIFLYEN